MKTIKNRNFIRCLTTRNPFKHEQRLAAEKVNS